MTIRAFLLFIMVLFVSVPCSGAGGKEGGAAMRLTSPEFENNGFIPKKFTCQGDNVNPALVIEDIPEGTKSLAIIVDDPDAPVGTWVHWVVYNVPVISEIQEGVTPGEECITDFGTKGYGGPCPPSGTHRYFFKVYALDVKSLDLPEKARKKDLEQAMQGHTLSYSEIIGLYKKR